MDRGTWRVIVHGVPKSIIRWHWKKYLKKLKSKTVKIFGVRMSQKERVVHSNVRLGGTARIHVFHYV